MNTQMMATKEVEVLITGDEFVRGTLEIKTKNHVSEMGKEWTEPDLSIPHTDEQQYGKKLILLLHGLNANRNSFFFPELAKKLPYSSYRFDFRGNGESSGKPAPFSEYNRREMEDVLVVMNAFKNKGWEIIGIIGHSKSGTLVLQMVGINPQLCDFVVNISGRLKVYEGMVKRFSSKMKELNDNGSFVFEVTTGGGIIHKEIITKKDIEAFKKCDEDISKLLKCPNPHTNILTVHGDADWMVVLQEQLDKLNEIKKHKLITIKDGNHTFDGCYNKPLDYIVEFISSGLPL